MLLLPLLLLPLPNLPIFDDLMLTAKGNKHTCNINKYMQHKLHSITIYIARILVMLLLLSLFMKVFKQNQARWPHGMYIAYLPHSQCMCYYIFMICCYGRWRFGHNKKLQCCIFMRFALMERRHVSAQSPATGRSSKRRTTSV